MYYELFRVNYLRHFLFVLVFFSIYYVLLNTSTNKSTLKLNISIQRNAKLFSPAISLQRLNRLFSILSVKEAVYSSIFSKLNVISFEELIANKLTSNQDASTYLQIKDGQIKASELFVQYLFNLSNRYSFHTKQRKSNQGNLEFEKTKQDKPVFMTAANHKYFAPLIETVQNLQSFFPDFKLIVYDLGLTSRNLQAVKAVCKCEIRTFDTDGIYSRISPHITNMITYSWKPLIIQEILSEYKSVIYLDSSIRFTSNKIANIFEMTREVGMLARYIKTNLTCYTDERMFKWFGADRFEFVDMFSLEANFLLFNRNFLTSLIMKSWLTCALDEECIAPKGSHIYGKFYQNLFGLHCHKCGCHRFDQDALTVVNSFFYGHPIDYEQSQPAYALMKDEKFFFDINRRTVLKYLQDQWKNLF